MPILRVWIVTSDEDLERRWTAALQERSHIVLAGTARQNRDVAELDVVLLDRPDDDEVREVTESHPTAYIVAAGDTLEARDDAQTVCRDLPARTLVRGLEWLYGPRTVLALVMGFAAEHRLAPQEVRVIYGTMLGRDRFQIAEELDISPDTVTSYWSRIFTKTGIHGRVEVIAAVVHTQVASDLVTSRLACAHALAFLSSLFRGRRAHARAASTEEAGAACGGLSTARSDRRSVTRPPSSASFDAHSRDLAPEEPRRSSTAPSEPEPFGPAHACRGSCSSRDRDRGRRTCGAPAPDRGSEQPEA